jgi:DNA-binding NtrC family response regulator/pSer/pThr/pTyr-binding forkhead associated (FHA) protein
MMPHFIITNNDGDQTTFSFPDADIIVIGRSPGNDLILPDESFLISRFHAAVIRIPGPKARYFVRDLSSLHGTRFTGKLVDQHLLQDGDVLEIAGYSLLYTEQATLERRGGRLRHIPRLGHHNRTAGLNATTKTTVQRQPALSDQQQEVLAELVERSGRTADESLLLAELLRDLANLMGASRGFIGIFRNAQGDDYDESAVIGMSPLDQIDITDQAALYRVRKGDAVQEDATLLVPLFREKTVLGFVCLDGSRVRQPYSRDEVEFAVVVGRVILGQRTTRKRCVAEASVEVDERFEWPFQIMSRSRTTSELLAGIHEASQSDSNVLILGETGTGKEVAARTIHARSARSKGPFIARNCAMLTETLAQAEIFGHAPRSGIYGADPQGSPGWFELAEGGYLLLDEIHALPLSVQDQFLRALQDREVLRVRAQAPVTVDVNVIAATDQDLEARVQQGQFRQALYFRFGKRLLIPPLRNRKDDIVLLAHAFLDNSAATRKTCTRSFSRRTLQLLTEYDWPGNVRELRDVVCNAAGPDRETLLSWDLDAKLARGARAWRTETGQIDAAPTPRLTMTDVEKEKIMEALEVTKGNISRAQRLLGYKSRQTLLNKMDGYGIPRDHGDPL